MSPTTTQQQAVLTDPDTPSEVVITTSSREPITDPTLGIPVAAKGPATARNRLVTIGDSLTHGFQSGAVFHTDLSYPVMMARALKLAPTEFRYPRYWGHGGIGMNLEFLLRGLEQRFGGTLSWYEVPLALFWARDTLSEAEHYWEDGPGSIVRESPVIKHNLGIFGWDLRDVYERTFDICRAEMAAPVHQRLLPNVENGNNLSALRVYPSGEPRLRSLTLLGAARELGAEGAIEDPDADGIETLVVFIGSNNALSAVTNLDVRWSGDGYDDLKRKDAYNVWRPSHFYREFDLVADEVATIRARHVIWATVPHVTVIPLAHGVGDTKVGPTSRYYPYYTYPWIEDGDFQPERDPHLTSQQARAIDSAIDMYNVHIVNRVRDARSAGLDWYLCDVAGTLDRLAYRRYVQDPNARPPWWTPYDLPKELKKLKIDSRFFESGKEGRTQGGIIALDGVHPTTVGYGIVAREFLRVMTVAGVFGPPATTKPPEPDWAWIVQRDGLISAPPASLAGVLKTVGWFDEAFDVIRHLFGRD